VSRKEDSLLKAETKKWLERLKKKKEGIKARNKKGEEFVRNIDAYTSDAVYFLNNRDLVRAFECVVWAWAWLEIGAELELLELKEEQIWKEQEYTS